MDELTYILGAGASHQSFPLVNTFSDRFNYFLNITRHRTTVHNKNFLSALDNFSNEIKLNVDQATRKVALNRKFVSFL